MLLLFLFSRIHKQRKRRVQNPEGSFQSKILWELNEDHKELLFLCVVRLFSSTRIAKIRKQSDRNIRKVRGTMLKKIRKKLLPALLDKAEK